MFFNIYLCPKQVQEEIANDKSLNKEYFPIGGNPEFIRNAQSLILGKETIDRWLNEFNYGIAGVQSLSGTGALRILCDFISKNYPNSRIFTSTPTWGNHKKIILHSGIKKELKYPYFDPVTKGINLRGMLSTLRAKSQPGDFVLLHACAHNPTGVDPTESEWKEIYNVIVNELRLIPFFDCAYQGFATGSLLNDSFAVRYFASQSMECNYKSGRGGGILIAQSFSKNLGLYNERIGCASVLTLNKKQSKAVDTQLRGIIRPMYSNPPSHGAYIVNRVLGKGFEENYKLWNNEMNKMSNQILEARRQLHLLLVKRFNTPGNWDHIIKQIGMFCFSGLNKLQVERLEKIHHVYMLSNGRISMAGVSPSDYKLKEDNDYYNVNYVSIDNNNKTKGNVEYLAKAIDEVVRFNYNNSGTQFRSKL